MCNAICQVLAALVLSHSALTTPSSNTVPSDMHDKAPGRGMADVAEGNHRLSAQRCTPERGPRFGWLEFDGQDRAAVIPNGTLTFPREGGWTVEFWIRPDRMANQQEPELGILAQVSRGRPGHDPWGFRVHSASFEFRVDGPKSGSHGLAFDLTLNAWHHVAGVYVNTHNERSMTVYVDGREIISSPVQVRMDSTDDPVVAGAFADDFGRGSFEGGSMRSASGARR